MQNAKLPAHESGDASAMVESVASIRSAILHEATLPQPGPLERANARALQPPGIVAGAYLSGGAAVAAENIGAQLSGSITAALIDPSRAEAAYEASVALIRDAYQREEIRLNVVA